MAPYKDPDRQREFQREWQGKKRTDWVARQTCELCGRGSGLRLFRHMGAPKIRWSKAGPSHRRFRIVCGDANDCLLRRARGAKPKPLVPRPPGRPPTNDGLTSYERKKLRGLHASKTSAKKKRKAVPVAKPKPPAPPPPPKDPPPVSKLARELERPDPRLVCAEHGPRNTTTVADVLRFVCCGQPVPNAPAPRKAHRWA